MYVTDPTNPEGMWETVHIAADKVTSWSVKGEYTHV